MSNIFSVQDLLKVLDLREKQILEQEQSIKEQFLINDKLQKDIINLKVERNSLQEKHFELSENVTRMYGVIANLRDQVNELKKTGGLNRSFNLM